jgi:hypothetical protein
MERIDCSEPIQLQMRWRRNGLVGSDVYMNWGLPLVECAYVGGILDVNIQFTSRVACAASMARAAYS